MGVYQHRFAIAIFGLCLICYFVGNIFTFERVIKDVSNLENYNRRVKAALQEIKENLIFRPPLSILPFVRSTAHYTGAPNYNLANCEVAKNMCTKMNGILCYLSETEGFLANHRDINKEEWHNTYCNWRNYYKNTNVKFNHMSEKHTTMFITRDPIQRFVSAFVDKCVKEKEKCYGCETDILCVVEKANEEIIQYSRNNSNLERKKALEKIDISYEGNHFTPMIWRCDLMDYFQEYVFIRYGEDEEFNQTRLDLYEILKKQGVEQEKIDYIAYALETKSSHATSSSTARSDNLKILLASRKHLEILTNIYYYDYLAFGFEPPVEIFRNNWPYFD